MTLAPRVEGSETDVNLTSEWNDSQPCDGQYMVALYSSSDYLVTFMGFHPAPATTSLSSESYMWWDLRFFPDRWAGVELRPERLVRAQRAGQGLPAGCSPGQQLGG